MAWTAVKRWLQANAPHLLDRLAPGASEVDLRAVEVEIGAPLPADFRAAWAEHDGESQESGASILPARIFLSLDEGLGRRAEMLAQAAGDELADEPRRIPPGLVPWSARWFPIACRMDRYLTCLDLDPDEDGSVGGVIEVEDFCVTKRTVLAPSFEAWMTRIARDLEEGRFALDSGGELQEVDEKGVVCQVLLPGPDEASPSRLRDPRGRTILAPPGARLEAGDFCLADLGGPGPPLPALRLHPWTPEGSIEAFHAARDRAADAGWDVEADADRALQAALRAWSIDCGLPSLGAPLVLHLLLQRLPHLPPSGQSMIAPAALARHFESATTSAGAPAAPVPQASIDNILALLSREWASERRAPLLHRFCADLAALGDAALLAAGDARRWRALLPAGETDPLRSVWILLSPADLLRLEETGLVRRPGTSLGIRLLTAATFWICAAIAIARPGWISIGAAVIAYAAWFLLRNRRLLGRH